MTDRELGDDPWRCIMSEVGTKRNLTGTSTEGPPGTAGKVMQGHSLESQAGRKRERGSGQPSRVLQGAQVRQ